jgi:hypothetical protein
MLRCVFAFTILASYAAGATGGFSWKQEQGRYVLYENGKPVLAYNHTVQSPEGVPRDRARCCYVHPIWSPEGVVLTDDFPADHYHHRGLFWAWTVVETGRGKYDLWMLKRIAPSSMSVSVESGNSVARFRARNRISVPGEEPIMREEVSITARPARDGVREFDIELELAAVSGPVVLRGSQERGKSYGGVSVRFAPRKQTAIRTDRGPLPKDDDLTKYAWAELEGQFEGGRAALRLTSHSANPGHPQQWVLRNYGFIGASFPGRSEDVEKYTLEPGTPLRLRYTVRVTDIKPKS